MIRIDMLIFQINVEKFAELGGFGNLNSARVNLNKVLKAVMIEEGGAGADGEASPGTGKKKATPSKRKAGKCLPTSALVACVRRLTYTEATEDDDDAEETPSKKKAAPKKKVQGKKASSAGAEDGQKDSAAVKDETADEDALL
jgi:hypothetical protein